VAYWDDSGDVYGARFGDVRGRESEAQATVTVLAEGPLIARARATFAIQGQPVTKTVSVRAGSPLVEVALEIRALPESSAVLHTPTTIETQSRTDDLGFMAFTHPIDPRPIASGDITYRRKIFYPIMNWSDVYAAGSGLALITHGLQGVGGAGSLHVLLTRSVSDEGREGVLDTDTHLLRFAYLPHTEALDDVWRLAYAFNQPLIPTWHAGDRIQVQVPFRPESYEFARPASGAQRPVTASLLSAESGLVADLHHDGAQVHALILDYDPATPVTLSIGASLIRVDTRTDWWVPVPLK
jgi:hypothetical protein